jgi:hypothetical protein
MLLALVIGQSSLEFLKGGMLINNIEITVFGTSIGLFSNSIEKSLWVQKELLG